MYGKNPNHANKFRRIFNKKYPPGNRRVVYSAISAGCIGSSAGGCIGRPAGFLCPCRGPDEKRSGDVPQRSGSIAKAVRGMPGDRPGALWNIRDPLRTGAFGTFGGFPVGGVRDVWRLSCRGRSRRSERGRSGRSEALRAGRSGAARSGGAFADGSFADGPDADRAASGCGYLISRSGCSRRKCSQLCDPLREAAFLPPPSPLTRSGPRAAWSGLEVV